MFAGAWLGFWVGTLAPELELLEAIGPIALGVIAMKVATTIGTF